MGRYKKPLEKFGKNLLAIWGPCVPSYTRFLEMCHALAEEHLLEDGCDVKRRYGDGVEMA